MNIFIQQNIIPVRVVIERICLDTCLVSKFNKFSFNLIFNLKESNKYDITSSLKLFVELCFQLQVGWQITWDELAGQKL